MSNLTYSDFMRAAKQRREKARRMAEKGFTQSAIARRLGISRQRVSKMLAK
jgi:DNA-binding transcriptional regulator LsrR (DeoR family)